MTRAGDAEPGRFGQLTYTCFDRPGAGRAGAGGWQVKDVSGGVSGDEQDLMRSGVVTRLEQVEPLPAFPTPGDLAARLRRLAYVPTAGGGGCFWHTVASGADASGRPGNVFAHVLLDRTGGTVSDAERPIGTWRSEDWLVPYGADAVARASLGDSAPRWGSAVDRATVLNFLLDPGTWRIGVLTVLLDAVAHAMNGGPAVVLGTESPESAALWIGAISQFMSPGSSRTFGWCTFDRRHTVDETVARGAHLVAVPLRDVADVREWSGLVLVDEDETPELGELGSEPHRTARGVAVPVTPWSMLSQAVLVDHDVAEHALARQDSIASFVGDRGLSPMWPLAMAVVFEPDLYDALDEASEVVLEQSPPAIIDLPALADVPLSLVDARFGNSTDQAWRVLAGLLDDGAVAPVVRDLAGRMFLFRALTDRAWIRGCTRQQLDRLDPTWVSEDVRVDARRVVAALQDRARSVSGREERHEVALDTVAMVDFLVAVSLVDGPVDDALFELLERAVVPILYDPIEGPAFVAEFGPVGPSTRIDYLQVAIAAHPIVAAAPLGERVPHAVLKWVVGETGQLAVGVLARDPDRIADPLSMLVAEGIFQAVDASTLATTSPLCLIMLRRLMFEALDGGWPTPQLDRIYRAFDWTSREMWSLVEEFPGVVPARVLQDSIVRGEWCTDIDGLISRVADSKRPGAVPVVSAVSDVDELAVSWAVIRDWGRWGGLAATDVQPLLERHFRPVLFDYAERQEADLPHDLRLRLVLLAVAYHACMPPGSPGNLPCLPRGHEAALARAAQADQRLVVDAVTSWIRSGVVDQQWAVAHAVFTSPAAPLVDSVIATRELLCRLEIGPASDRRSLLEESVWTLMGEPGYRGPVDACGVMEGIRMVLRYDWTVDPDYVCRAYEPFVRTWIERPPLSAGRVRWK